MFSLCFGIGHKQDDGLTQSVASFWFSALGLSYSLRLWLFSGSWFYWFWLGLRFVWLLLLVEGF